MSIKQLFCYSFTFSAMSGIVNILGIRQLGVVLTNVTGHFSSAVIQSNGQLHKDLATSFIYIFLYALGAFWAYACFSYGKKKGINWLKVLPIVLNLTIFLYAILTQTLPTFCLIFAMSSQNAIGSNHSDMKVRPSQITGVVMNVMQDLATYFLGRRTKETGSDIICKLLNILGFILGGLIAFHYNSISILWLPLLFYVALSVLVLREKL